MRCFCAFCRSERKVYTKKRISFSDILSCALGAATIMFAIWQGFDPRVMLIFVVFLAMAETFVHLRWRLAIVCPHCGFDPVLYAKEPEKAAQKVKLHLDKRKLDPASLLKPALRIPHRKVKKSNEPLLSKQV